MVTITTLSRAPFHFRCDNFAGSDTFATFASLTFTLVLFIKLVNVNDLASVFKRTAADQRGWVLRVSAVLFYVVITDSARLPAPCNRLLSQRYSRSPRRPRSVLRDAVAVSRRVFRGVDEETFLHRLEVAADFSTISSMNRQALSFRSLAISLSRYPSFLSSTISMMPSKPIRVCFAVSQASML